MRRKRPTVQLPAEVWGQVATHLYENPRKAFMLLCAVKGLQINDTYWQKLWAKNVANCKRKKWKQHFLLTYEVNRPELCKVVLRLVYGMFCSQCGCRFHHTIFEPYKMRVCKECLREKHISNAVLWHDYGIALEEISLHFRNHVRYLGVRQWSLKDIKRYSTSERDIKSIGKLVFFWKPDIERLFDLVSRRVQHMVCLQSISTLKAVFQRKYTELQRGRYLLEKLHDNEVNRLIKPITYQRALAGTNWNLSYMITGRACPVAPTHVLSLTLGKTHVMPLLADDEYTARTALFKLRLNAEILMDWIQAMQFNSLGVNNYDKIFKIGQSRHK